MNEGLLSKITKETLSGGLSAGEGWEDATWPDGAKLTGGSWIPEGRCPMPNSA